MKDKLIFLMSLTLLLASCNAFSKKEKEAEKPLARVKNEYLYLSDISAMFKNLNADDSLKVLNAYVDDWVKNKLVIQQAEESLQDNMAEIENKVADYRQSLIIYNFEKEMIAQKMDTTISSQQIEQYYEDYKDNFLLTNDLYQIEFIQAINQSPNLNEYEKLLKSDKQEDRVKLKAIVKNNAINYSLEKDRWYTPVWIQSKLLMNPESLSRGTARVNTEGSVLLVRLNTKLSTGAYAPLSQVKDQIKETLLNKHRSEFIKAMNKKIYEDGLNNKHAEVYQ